MAWPPPLQNTSRTNATPQLDTHASDHNSLGLAINDIVAQLSGRRLVGLQYASNVQQSGAVGVPNGGVYDTNTVSLGAAPWPVAIHCHADVYFGYGNGWINGNADVVRFVDMAVALSAPPGQAIAGTYALRSIDWGWSVAAGQDMGFKVRYSCLQAEPGMNTGYYDARVSYQVTNI